MVVTSTKLVLASSQLLIPVLDDFHFRVLAFLQGLSTCFHLNLALLTQKIHITIRTMGVRPVAMLLLKIQCYSNFIDIRNGLFKVLLLS